MRYDGIELNLEGRHAERTPDPRFPLLCLPYRSFVSSTTKDNKERAWDRHGPNVTQPPPIHVFLHNVVPEAITTATTYMYADDTTLYCIGDSIDAVISELNKALEELLYWCKTNSLVPHPKKCEAMILHRGRFTGPLKELTLAQHTIKWVTHSRLLGVSIDDQLNWSLHVSVVKKGFVDKLNLLKRFFQRICY